VNLYPFEDALARGAAFEECVDMIDIGGPAMIRAAAKNHAHVTVATDTDDLVEIVAEMRTHAGATTLALRRRLAAKAFARTAAYDAAISNWFSRQIGEKTPTWRTFGGRLRQSLRYGENPHQTGAFYVEPEKRFGVATARQMQGKELSYNNLNDTDAAYELVAEFDPIEKAAAAIIKHANPCGVALGDSLIEAYERAFSCDKVSAFGGIVAVNRTLDRSAAEAIVEIFTEVVIAPDADEEAIAVFARKKNLRLLLAGGLPDPQGAGLQFRSLAGGLLVQDRDASRLRPEDLRIVTRLAPTSAQIRDMLFAFTVCKHVKSNAIVYAKAGRTLGIGAGQMNRRDAARIAALRGQEAAEAAGDATWMQDSVCASDAFFPFPDGLLEAAKAGVASVIQPGGSIRDDEVIQTADDAGLAMAFTGVRHFRH
jgi:phosphoribosylaminoimidazolecarboxamide formyltransferase/IMP cyclohydrolase